MFFCILANEFFKNDLFIYFILIDLEIFEFYLNFQLHGFYLMP